MKEHSAALIKRLQIKPRWETTSHPLGRLPPKTPKTARVAKDTEETEPCVLLVRTSQQSYFWVHSPKNPRQIAQRSLHTQVHGSTVHDSHRQKQPSCPLTGEQGMARKHAGILFSLKKEGQSDTC